MLPQPLITEFWATVKKSLREEHELGEEPATQAIVAYRALLEKHQVGEIIYHRDPEDVASTIAGGLLRGGFEEPQFGAVGGNDRLG